MTYETIQVERSANGITTITLNRPEKHNAMNALMMDELCNAAETLDQDDKTRVVILAASGETFCAGGDLRWMQAQAEEDRNGKMKEASRLAGMLKRLDAMKKPLIARVHGNAFGGGIGLLSVCDIVVASSGLKFALTETRLGLIPATIGPYVVRRMGEGKARQVFMNAKVFDTERAHDLGLVSIVADPQALEHAVLAEAKAFFACAPGAVADAKALCQHLARTQPEGQIEHSINMLADRWESEEAQNGISAFFGKRKPDWQL
ncbi:crotonase/enoyl-CoA hydratase family protein [Rhodobacteraceae bacterium RKSG542]|uniref:crotonase/enoyl-CoA hydratase family protein n=1 Tax=Pseudovibrio flavus TaxID=2529854 RepID=UPI0012BC7ACC|nr:crotonase/enoyl-CoA hydratase family protein [Pseudovibrio flavus]MTI16058.1 crotonase/enoyl-CoA hydratase family protein [Pseudovibrio flavus]